MRRLQVTKAGYWYIVLTIGIGVVALVSGNNVLNLMECMLLGGMILSGVVSEKAISSIDVKLYPRQAIAGLAARDELTVTNRSRLPFFCVEVLEWRERGFERVAFFLRIAPGEVCRVRVSRVFPSRGTHAWQGLGVATAGPFGFARKIRVAEGAGSRLVWPGSVDGTNVARPAVGAGTGEADAEVRLFAHGDDARSIVWKLSAKGQERVVRKRSDEQPELFLKLDLRAEPGEEFERRIAKLASEVYRTASDVRNVADARIRLFVEGTGAKRRTILHMKPVLDFLAATRAEGET